MSKIQGGDMMLFIDGVSIGYATNHTLEIEAELSSFDCKDEGEQGWSNEETVLLNWTATSENIYAHDPQGKSYENLYDIMIERRPIDAVFYKKKESGSDVPTGGWTSADKPFRGQVLITDLDLVAQHGEYAQFTATFTGWGELIDESSINYLWFTPKDRATRFKFTKNQPVDVDIEYSLDDGETWNYLQSGEATPLVEVGQKIYWRGELGVQTFHYSDDEVLMEDMGIGTFDVTEYAVGTNAPLFNVGGDPNSLLTYDFYKLNDLSPYLYAFVNLFHNSHVYDSSQMIFRDIKLSQHCYCNMFSTCLQMVKTVDELPSQQLASYCYDAMYNGCIVLTKAPELPAIKTVWGTYMWMFNNCKRLKESPRLVAQDLGFACYVNMFRGCSNLERVYLDVKNIDTHVFDYSNSNPFGNWLLNAAPCGVIVGSDNTNWYGNTSIMNNMDIPEHWVVTNAENTLNAYDIKLYNNDSEEIDMLFWSNNQFTNSPITAKAFKYGNLFVHGTFEFVWTESDEIYNGSIIVNFDTIDGDSEIYTQPLNNATVDISKMTVGIDDGVYIVIRDNNAKPLTYKKYVIGPDIG